MIQISAIRTLNEWQMHEDSWNKLCEAVALPLPFLTFTWLTKWWDVFSKTGLWRQNELYILVAVDESNAVIGYMPMFLTTYSIGFIRLLTYLRPIGSDPNITEIRGIICEAGRTAQVWRAFYAFLTKDKGVVWDFAQWPTVERAIMIQEAKSRRWFKPVDVDTFVLTLKPTWEEFNANLKRNIRESIRKCYNAPKRDNLELTFVVWQGSEILSAPLDIFFRLHHERAVSESGPDHPDYFALKTHRDFIRTLCQTETNTLRPILFGIKRGDELVAARMAFLVGDTMYMYFSGYQQALAKYSISLRNFVEALKYAIGQNIKYVNLSIGYDVSKARWSPDNYALSYGFESSGSLSGLLFWLIYFHPIKFIRQWLNYSRRIRHGSEYYSSNISSSSRVEGSSSQRVTS